MSIRLKTIISIQVYGGTEMYEIDSGRSVPILRSKADAQLHVEYSYFGESLQSENVKISASRETKDDISLFKFYTSNKKSNSINYLRKKNGRVIFERVMSITSNHCHCTSFNILLSAPLHAPAMRV